MNIKTDRLLITVLDGTMAEILHLNSLDEDNQRFVPDEVFETVEEATDALKWLMDCYQGKEGPFVYPVLLHDGKNIGYVQAVQIEEGWEIGYHIAKAYTGNGYATEAVAAFLPVIMQQLKLSCIYGICVADNLASRKVMDRCGFVLEYEGPGSYLGIEQPICRYRYSR